MYCVTLIISFYLRDTEPIFSQEQPNKVTDQNMRQQCTQKIVCVISSYTWCCQDLNQVVEMEKKLQTLYPSIVWTEWKAAHLHKP